jgi:hypothetical protein
MQLLNNFFNYSYYRIAKAYFKWDGSTGITAIIVLTLFQCMSVCDFIIIILRLFLQRSETIEYTKMAIILGGGIYILLCVLNFSRYKNKYEVYELRWGNEKHGIKRTRGILLVISLILPLLIMIFLGRIQL